MERIPRTAIVGVLAIAAVVGLGSAGRAVDAADSSPGSIAATATTSQRSVLTALPRRHALRSGGIRLAITVPKSGPSARVRVAVRTRPLAGVVRVDLAVDGVRAVGLRPTSGRFYGAVGWIKRSRFMPGKHRVVLTITRKTGRLRAALRITVPKQGGAVGGTSPSLKQAAGAAPTSSTSIHPIMWGAYIDGDAYGADRDDPPWDMTSLSIFEAHAGKRASILHYGQPWKRDGVLQPFRAADHQRVRDHGSIPLVDWNPWELAQASSSSQPDFALRRIIDGNYDAYITAWATGAKQWGHPLFLRFAHEMNGDWYPWSEVENGNSAGEYVAAWRHVHDIFASVGANNVSWVWSPNVIYSSSIPLGGLYPGNAYVDWVAADGYNWGTNPAKAGESWKSFTDVFAPTYDALGALAPGKPMMIAEFGSTEIGGSKAAWIADALATLPTRFPKIRAALWFNWTADSMNWPIESSASAQAAFAKGISSTAYAGSDFGSLASGVIAAP